MNFLIHIILFLLLNCCFSVFYSSPLKPNVNIKYHLAISINPGANSSYVNYAIVGENSGNLVYTKFISLNEFIQIAKGKQFSPANQVGKNIFKDFKSILNLKKLNQDINFIANFGRDVEYYTGIVFEVFSGKKEIARGGRYNDLLKSLGAKKNIPAVGAAINLKNI